MSGCLWLLPATVHHSEAMQEAGFRGQNTVIVNALQKALSSKPAATVTLMHAYDGILGIVSRTAGQMVLLLRAECSAEQAPPWKQTLTPTVPHRQHLITVVRTCHGRRKNNLLNLHGLSK